MIKIDSEFIVKVFDGLFADQYNTRLVSGGSEPEYLPASGGCPFNQLIFRSDYAASALHEVAHWCIAGVERRRLIDFGYWYCPDGRDPSQQTQFEQVEVKPQALECLFTLACGWRFTPSVDNLMIDNTTSQSFVQALREQIRRYALGPMPQRAERFLIALLDTSELFDDAQLFAKFVLAELNTGRLLPEVGVAC